MRKGIKPAAQRPVGRLPGVTADGVIYPLYFVKNKFFTLEDYFSCFNGRCTESKSQMLWSVITGPDGYTSNHGWIMINNVWNRDGIIYNQDYQITGSYNNLSLVNGATFNWKFPINDKPWTVVRAYPDLLFGASPWGRSEADPSYVFPIEIQNLKALTTNFAFVPGGAVDGYNVAYDIFFTSKPDGGVSSITNELMIWLHKGHLVPYGEQIGTYTDGLFSAKIYHSGTYTAVVADNDTTAGTVDVAKIIYKLEDLGVLSPCEYLTSIQFGAEVVEGTGSLTVNQLTMNVVDVQADEIVVTKITGSGAAVAGTLPYKVGIQQLFSADGNFTGLKSTSIDASGTIFVQWSDASGKMTGADTLHIDADGVLLTQHFSSSWQFLGATRLGTDGNDSVAAGEGADLVIAGNGNDVISGEAGNDVLYGQAGFDFISGGDGDDTIAAGADIDTVAGGAGNDLIFGEDGSDTLYGEAGTDLIYGNDGDDTIAGGADADILVGGAGNDMIFGEDGNDTIYGETGDDHLRGGAGADIISADIGNDIVVGEAGNDLAFGGAGNDTMYGEAGDDHMRGDDGDDVISGGEGSDILVGGLGNDLLIADAGDDVIHGEDGNDVLYAGNGADIIVGGLGNDTMFGEQGDDVFLGEAGNDIMTGGAGTDQFNISAGYGHDAITDFGTVAGNDDVIRFSGIFGDFASVLQASYQVGGSVVIAVDAADTIELYNTQLASLTNADFLFA
jgi:Ca2+-binding RTX toxin-like protein